MTSAKDFRLISVKNALGLGGIVVAVLIPVGMRWYWAADLSAIEAAEREAEVEQAGLEAGLVVGGGTGLVLLDSDDEEEGADDAGRDPGRDEDELPGSR